MKKVLSQVALSVIMLTGLSCTAHMFPRQSSFFAKFSLHKLVEKNQSRFGMDCSAGGGGGGIGGGTGSFGRKEFHSHQGESFFCRLNPDKADEFDDAGFLVALRQAVEKELSKSGARVVSSGAPDVNSFYFDYATENVEGHVEIHGRKMRGDYYSLKADLDERGKREAR